ncbi:MAG TPA: phosphoribosylamine--glycine ligase [Rhodospirillaceae bacterium]|nr:phosphoribosylamine--glycine ligase [Candidatus Neomarinimicrobiota bacterium]HCX14832.1 phosphoribosylamine--glycine ligase [Rhodospirillaceae bacterium]
MRVLVVGSGGREHALCWSLGASPLCKALYCAPGNAGIADAAICVPISADDIDGLIKFSKDEKIDFVVVGPEAPLVAGLVDKLKNAGIKSFGPSAKAAQLEGSKGFMKDLLQRHNIPTAWYRRFKDPMTAKAFISDKGAPIVVKADGLAGGKGVILCTSVEDAHTAVDTMMAEKAFGDAGNEIVIEEFLEGEEASFFAIVDGECAIPLATAQDHKAVGEGDTGPNTGGMGAYSPAPIIDAKMQERIMNEIILPTVSGMALEGYPFTGVLFAGLMINKGNPKILEFNVRFGDPECQVLLARLKSDLLPALIAATDSQLNNFDLRWYDDAAITIVMAADGYPSNPKKGTMIEGLIDAAKVENVTVFHAGTKTEDRDGKITILANGGRVLGITATGKTVTEAQKQAYRAVDAISWPGGFCRRDIGWRAIERENTR